MTERRTGREAEGGNVDLRAQLREFAGIRDGKEREVALIRLARNMRSANIKEIDALIPPEWAKIQKHLEKKVDHTLITLIKLYASSEPRQIWTGKAAVAVLSREGEVLGLTHREHSEEEDDGRVAAMGEAIVRAATTLHFEQLQRSGGLASRDNYKELKRIEKRYGVRLSSGSADNSINYDNRFIYVAGASTGVRPGFLDPFSKSPIKRNETKQEFFDKVFSDRVLWLYVYPLRDHGPIVLGPYSTSKRKPLDKN